jgi:hypothetical protein
MRYHIIVPAAPLRHEYSGIIKADNAEAARFIVRQWLGETAAVFAIVTPVPCSTLADAVRRKGPQP